MALRTRPPTILLALAAVALLLPAPALADGAHGGGGFGAAPSHLAYGGVVRGEPITRTLTLQNGGDAPADVVLAAVDGIGHWLDLPREPLHVAPASALRVDLTLRVPQDAPNADYGGNVTATQTPRHNVSSGSGVNVALAVRIGLAATLGGPQVVDLRAGELAVEPAEAGQPLLVRLVVENHGNVRASPRLAVTLLGPDGRQAHGVDVPLDAVSPGGSRNLTARVPHALPSGQYRLEAQLLDGTLQLVLPGLLVEVLEAGSLRRRGEMGPLSTLSLDREPNHRLPAGKPFLLRAPFRNVGEVEVEAVFRGSLLRDGDVVRSLETLPRAFAPGEAGDIELMLDGLTPGTYAVRGRVEFDGRVTPDHETVVNLEAVPGATKDVPGAPLIVVLAALAGCARLAGRCARIETH